MIVHEVRFGERDCPFVPRRSDVIVVQDRRLSVVMVEVDYEPCATTTIRVFVTQDF